MSKDAEVTAGLAFYRPPVVYPRPYWLYNNVLQNVQWSSGNTLACGARGPRFESRCGQKFVFTKITAIRSFGHGLHTDCSA